MYVVRQVWIRNGGCIRLKRIEMCQKGSSYFIEPKETNQHMRMSYDSVTTNKDAVGKV